MTQLEIAPGLTQHTVVLCVEKRERGIATQQLLGQMGYRVVLATSLYEALKIITQEMPHLVISEALLSDGNAGNLFDKLQADKTLSKMPIKVHLIKKSKEEIGALAGKKFGGFYMGPFEPKGFAAKIREIMVQRSIISPFYYGSVTVGLKEEFTINIEAAVIGKSGEQIISKSSTEVAAAAALICVPKNPSMAPAMLRMATNVKGGDDFFNLFPMNRIVGKGRLWLEKLPEMNIDNVGAKSDDGQVAPRKIIFYDPNESRFEGFKEILTGYDIDLLYAKSLSMAAAILKREGGEITGVYLHELMNDATGIEWKNAYAKLPASSRPPMIVGTTASNMKSADSIRYIKRPFGLGVLVEMFQATFIKSSAIIQAAGTSSSVSGIQVLFQAPAKLVGLDETGGIIQIKFPLVKGSKVQIGHEVLNKIWEGNAVVSIVSAASIPDKPDVWQARFESLAPGMSKAKYWEKVSRLLEQHKASVGAPDATPGVPIPAVPAA